MSGIKYSVIPFVEESKQVTSGFRNKHTTNEPVGIHNKKSFAEKKTSKP